MISAALAVLFIEGSVFEILVVRLGWKFALASFFMGASFAWTAWRGLPPNYWRSTQSTLNQSAQPTPPESG